MVHSVALIYGILVYAMDEDEIGFLGTLFNNIFQAYM